MDNFDSLGYGPCNMLAAPHVRYAEQSASYLPIRIFHDNKQYLINHDVIEIAQVQEQLKPEPTETLTVNDFVLLAQQVLGLKVNEIAKLVDVSRATLDLHRKGSNAKDLIRYHRAFEFVSSIQRKYGDSIKIGLRNILVNKKTLLQHFIEHKENLFDTEVYIKEVASKIHLIKINNSSFEKEKLNLRTSNIGRIA